MDRRGFLKWLAGAAVIGAAAFTGFGSRLWRNAGEGPQQTTGGLTPSATPADASKQPESTTAAGGPLMAFFLLSDLHVNSGIDYPSEHLKKALTEVTQTFSGKVDTLLFGGDVTESGTDKDYKELRSVLSKYKLPPVHANMGNHDYYNVWIDKNGNWSKETFPNGKTDEQSKKAFCDFFGLDKPYHDTRVKGYHIILLSQEIYQQTRTDVGEGAWYSDEQLEWLKGRLAENKDGKPVFILIHQPLPAAGQDGGSHRLIPAKKFREILKPYPNVFVFSGHNHQDFQNGTQHYVKETFHWFHNSSVGRVLNAKYQHEKQNAAQGLYVEVYGDRVVLRGREFSTGQWLPEAEWTVKLQSAKV
ncbi:metallophosphoesterase family protein [Gorillibacterium sp. sgz5001074]|uniref:metallophosphoesterase family protein n=1 Tax=Gorillibacterium sp. sgz5001074 TaxID=3446695 RepID=UPI003F666BC5